MKLGYSQLHKSVMLKKWLKE